MTCLKFTFPQKKYFFLVASYGLYYSLYKPTYNSLQSSINIQELGDRMPSEWTTMILVQSSTAWPYEKCDPKAHGRQRGYTREIPIVS